MVTSRSVAQQQGGSRELLAESAQQVAAQLIFDYSASKLAAVGSVASQGTADAENVKKLAQQMFSNGVENILSKELTKLTLLVLQEAKKYMLKSKRLTLHPQDLLNALKTRGLNHYYYLVADDAFSQKKTTEPSLDIASCVELNNDKILDVNLISSTIHCHWLCIDGVQPMVNENPNVAQIEKEAENKLVSGLKSAPGNPLSNKHDATVEGLNLLSYEQQLLFSNITEMCFGTDEDKQNMALNLLRTDPGFVDLLPHFVSFIVEGVRLNVNEQNMVNLIYLMRMTSALVSNSCLNIEHYLHDLIPAIMTCVLTKTLYKKSEDSHWALRDYSAKLITCIYALKTNAFNNHHSQIFRLIDEIIDTDNMVKYSWNAKYGAVKVLCEMNNQVIVVHLLDKLQTTYKRMKEELESANCEPSTQKAIQKILHLLQDRLGCRKLWQDANIDVDVEVFTDKFGELGQILYAATVNKS